MPRAYGLALWRFFFNHRRFFIIYTSLLAFA